MLKAWSMMVRDCHRRSAMRSRLRSEALKGASDGSISITSRLSAEFAS
jgi:hypothetical protein